MKISRSGFTITEIMITLVIMSVVVGLAVPNYLRTVEQARSHEARNNLNIIHMGQKINRLNNGVYWGPGGTTIGATNTALSIDMQAVHYTTLNVSLPNGTSYQATFTRNGVDRAGVGTKWFRYNYTDGDPAPVLTEGGVY